MEQTTQLRPDGYPKATWRLIVDAGPRTGAWNMALDEAIMQAVGTGEAPPTLRLYQWDPPCLSLGKRQPLSGVDLEGCWRDGVDVVRRATGGWAILHTDELTYSVSALPTDPRAEGAILDAYRRLSAGLVAGLHRLGVPAAMNPVDPFGVHNTSAACFEVPSAYEVTIGEKKLIGSAQTRPQGRVLQHGSLPLTGDIARVVNYLWFQTEDDRTALAEHLRERATTLGDVLGRPVSFEEAAKAIAEGFAEALTLDFEPGSYTDAEMEAAERIAQEKADQFVSALE
ncbi:MAG TPA: biotin/lipoate A/B protein ligase family protein [Ktedonobacterales bacterium]